MNGFLVPVEPDAPADISWGPEEAWGGVIGRAFAECQAAVDFVRFAERWGVLGGGLTEQVDVPGIQGSVPGEALSSWARETALVRRAFRLLDGVNTQNQECLEKLFRWIDDDSVLFQAEGCDFVSDAVNQFPLYRDTHSIGERPDLLPAAASYLLELVNSKLDAEVSLAMLLDVEERNRLRWFLRPRGLLGMLWLGIAAQIRPGDAGQRCQACGAWFSPKRSGARYCSPRCRVRDNDHKKRDAVRKALQQGGES